MSILTILVALYILIGVVYAVYLQIVGASKWYFFLLNALLGPVTMLYITIKTLKGERIRL